MSTNPPTLPSLDVHGVDDAGVYHPPSRARYEEMLATIAALEWRVTDLQTAGTHTENERRKFKALYEASRSLLLHTLVDGATYLLACKEIKLDEETTRTMLADIDRVRARIDLLERDAWSGAANEARRFLCESSEALKTLRDADSVTRSEVLVDLIKRWQGRFTSVTR